MFTYAVAQDLRGHGGPVRTISVTPSGTTAITGSFDTSVIVWRLQSGAASAVLRKHEGSVNAVASLDNEVFLTGGDDGRVIVWKLGDKEPARIIDAHPAPVSDLTISSDDNQFASSGWDGEVRIWRLSENNDAPVALSGHSGPVNSVIFLDADTLISGGYDATVRFWRDGRETKSVQLPSPVNKIVKAGSAIFAACADGHVRRIDVNGAIVADYDLGTSPIVALATSPRAKVAVAGSIDGRVIVLDLDTGALRAKYGSRGWPVWALAFTPDGAQFFSGGGDGIVRRWDTASGQPLASTIPDSTAALTPELTSSRGAQVYKACIACHTLNDGSIRAGPTLHGIMGRRIASHDGYVYSEALKRLDIVWTKDTIARLFEIGPQAYTPGTKMPEQRLNGPDRQALVDFLEKATQ